MGHSEYNPAGKDRRARDFEDRVVRRGAAPFRPVIMFGAGAQRRSARGRKAPPPGVRPGANAGLCSFTS
jgi:hypothetical protein